MERNYSPLTLFGGYMPEEQSLYLDDKQSEQLGYQKPSVQLFQTKPSPLFSQDPVLEGDRLFGDCDDISAMLDKNDIFQSLWDDFPMDTSVEQNISASIQPVKASLPSVSDCMTEKHSFEPTLAQLNAPISEATPVNAPQIDTSSITLDEIESIIFDDLHSTDIKSAVSPTAVVPESVEIMRVQSPSKPIVTSSYLQQLLSEGEEGVNALSEASSLPSAAHSTLPLQQLLSVQERPLVPVTRSPNRMSPPTHVTMKTSPNQLINRSAHSSSQNYLRRPMKKPSTKFSLASGVDKPYVGRYGNSSSSSGRSDKGRSSSREGQGQGSGEPSSYFWQYNTQAKGPKGQRLCRSLTPDDPHKLMSFEDPVFDPDLSRWNLRHTGKARRGDGNDISPNPYRLHQIGKELNKLNNLLDGIAPEDARGGELRRAKRAKNKFASRACRLKRKAQHEANKVKLFGLQREHGQLLSVLGNMKDTLRHYLRTGTCDDDSLASTLGHLSEQLLTVTVAGRTSEYVSKVLERVAAGDRSGGLYSR